MNSVKWSKREFHFDEIPLDHQQLIKRILATADRLRKMLASIPEVEMEIRNEGKWSIKENAGHLIDLQDLNMTRFKELKEGKAVFTPADMTNIETEAADHDSVKIRSLLSTLETRRKELAGFISSMTDTELTNKALHERLGIEMNAWQLLYFIAEHDDHHINTIKGIIAALDFDE